MLASISSRRAAPALLLTVVVGAALVLTGPDRPADAAVEHRTGFTAIVDGFTSWYGSYGMGSIGTAWCIDHGIPAPDPALGYVATTPTVDESTRTAMAWVLGRHGWFAGRIESAALMLVMHDLMGARYPSGRLDVDQLGVDRLAGFGGTEAAVLTTARRYKAEALAHASLRGPYRLTVEAGEEPGDGPRSIDVAVHDARGAAVAGADLLIDPGSAAFEGSGHATTDGRGRARVVVDPGDGAADITVHAVAPDLDLDAFAPTVRRAQRVARPAQVMLSETITLDAPERPEPPPTARLTIRKLGDAEPHVPVAGATFAVQRDGTTVARATIDAHGTSGPIELDPGTYTVVETSPPAGYDAADPLDVELGPRADVEVEIVNRSRPGALRIDKFDRQTGEPVGGARVQVARIGDDAPADQREPHEVVVPSHGIELADLAPGPYRVTEVAAPDGYRADARPRDVMVTPDAVATVELFDSATATVRFAKSIDGPAPADQSLAGAVFAVQHDDEVVARCETDESGACDVPVGTLDARTGYCWIEERAPTGLGLATGACFETGEPGTTTDIAVAEPTTWSHLGGRKVDADTGTPLGGATYALRGADGHALGEATSDDADGRLEFGFVAGGASYCAVEVRAPAGYAIDSTPVCLEVAAGDEAVFELSNRRAPVSPRPTTATTAPAAPAPPATPPPPAKPPAPAAPTPTIAAGPALPRADLPRTGTSALRTALAGAALLLAGVAALGAGSEIGGDGRFSRRRRRARTPRNRARTPGAARRTRWPEALLARVRRGLR